MPRKRDGQPLSFRFTQETIGRIEQMAKNERRAKTTILEEAVAERYARRARQSRIIEVSAIVGSMLEEYMLSCEGVPFKTSNDVLAHMIYVINAFTSQDPLASIGVMKYIRRNLSEEMQKWTLEEEDRILEVAADVVGENVEKAARFHAMKPASGSKH